MALTAAAKNHCKSQSKRRSVPIRSSIRFYSPTKKDTETAEVTAADGAAVEEWVVAEWAAGIVTLRNHVPMGKKFLNRCPGKLAADFLK